MHQPRKQEFTRPYRMVNRLPIADAQVEHYGEMARIARQLRHERRILSDRLAIALMLVIAVVGWFGVWGAGS